MTTAAAPPVAAARPALVFTSMRWGVRPADAIASCVRELLTVVYRELLEPDEAQSIAMAAHELLENVVKYSASGESSFDIEIFDHGDRAVVRLQTKNAVAPERAEELRRLVERIHTAADPVRHYDELIASSVHREGSGLGLARIRAEGGMQLTCTMDGDQVAVIAERGVSIRRSK